jgi:hypothetical protein
VITLRVCFCQLHQRILSIHIPQNKAYPHTIKMYRSSSSTKGSLTIFRRKLFRKKTKIRIRQQTVKIKTIPILLSRSHFKAGLTQILRRAYLQRINRTNKPRAKKRLNKNKNVHNLHAYHIWNLPWLQLTISDQITIPDQITISDLNRFSAQTNIKWKNMVKIK